MYLVILAMIPLVMGAGAVVARGRRASSAARCGCGRTLKLFGLDGIDLPAEPWSEPRLVLQPVRLAARLLHRLRLHARLVAKPRRSTARLIWAAAAIVTLATDPLRVFPHPRRRAGASPGQPNAIFACGATRRILRPLALRPLPRDCLSRLGRRRTDGPAHHGLGPAHLGGRRDPQGGRAAIARGLPRPRCSWRSSPASLLDQIGRSPCDDGFWSTCSGFAVIIAVAYGVAWFKRPALEAACRHNRWQSAVPRTWQGCGNAAATAGGIPASMNMLNRRNMLQLHGGRGLSLAPTAFARAQEAAPTESTAATPSTYPRPIIGRGQAVPFAHADVIARARDIASRPYEDAAHRPTRMGGARLRPVQQHPVRRPLGAVVRRGDRLRGLKLRSPGLYFTAGHRAERRGRPRERRRSPRRWSTIPRPSPAPTSVPDLPESPDLGFTGFQLRHPINEPWQMEEFAVFQGASYFRAIGKRTSSTACPRAASRCAPPTSAARSSPSSAPSGWRSPGVACALHGRPRAARLAVGRRGLSLRASSRARRR